MVSGNFFQVLGMRPSMGRLIGPGNDYRGGGEGVLGGKITLNGHPFQIMGVTPPNFSGVEVGRTFDVAIPLCAEPVFSNINSSLMDSPKSWWLATVGRLKPGWIV